MKKIVLLALASVLFLLPQCKKNTVTPVEDNGFYMTLTAGYGDRTAFTPSTGSFVWSDGETEYIYVGGSNHTNCLGKLSGTGTGTGSMTFSGTLTTTPSNGETLYFFYLGKGAEKTGTALTTLDFSTQDGTLANVTDYHIAIGTGSYTSGSVNYATTLDMKSAIAYFNVSSFGSSNVVYVHGNDVYSTATVDYQNGMITGNTKGYINVGTSGSGKYVALIPSVTTETVVKFDSNTKTGSLTFNRGIQAGKYYANGNDALAVTAHSLPEGAAPGLFSISATEKVRFSQGNLQYRSLGAPDAGVWRFAEHQYDFVGDATNGTVEFAGIKSNNALISVDYVNGWIDLFGWGTSGYHNPDDEGNIKYYPYSTGTANGGTYNQYGYGPSLNMTDYNLVGTSANYDWGVYNRISNGGNQKGLWHTLQYKDQGNGYYGWEYIISRRSTPSGMRYAKAQITGVNAGANQYVNGLILLPDDWNEQYYSLNNVNQNQYGNEVDFSANTITLYDWVNSLQSHGAVFLPAAGCRYSSSISYVGSCGLYWSTNDRYDVNWTHSRYAYSVVFRNISGDISGMHRYEGHSVRLVMDVN